MSWLTGAVRVLHTIRHLGARQVWSLLHHRLLPSPRPRDVLQMGAFDQTGPVVSKALGALGPVDLPEAINTRVAAFREGNVQMLGRSVKWQEAWADERQNSPLWRYHLHYHDLFADLAWVASRTVDAALLDQMIHGLTDWMDRWEQGGRPAWDPYPVSVRLVNWLRIWAWTKDELPGTLRKRMATLHATHVDLLARSMEWHLQGNHLLRNASSLLIGASCWSGEYAANLQKRGRNTFFSQLGAQVSEDGLHQEHSPMYHVRALRDAIEVVTVLEAVGESVPNEVQDRVKVMAEVVPRLRRGNGALFHLNDSTNDHGVDVDVLMSHASRVVGASSEEGRGVHVLDGGKLVFAADPRTGDRLLAYLSHPHPPNQPGHAHAGALSIDYEIAGLPLLVDPGCSGYDGDPYREYFRSTRAHNTVTIEGKDQSEMWGVFRVARRARVDVIDIQGDVDDLIVQGVCRPYQDPAAAHHRCIRRSSRCLAVEDTVSGAVGGRVAQHWHIHPDWQPEHEGEVIQLTHVSGYQAVISIRGVELITLHRGESDPMNGWFAEGFGKVVPTWTIRATLDQNGAQVIRTEIQPIGS